MRYMIGIYCQKQHGSRSGLCTECALLYEYAQNRLEHCPFQAEKPTCAHCTVHCYKAEMRAGIREVMRFSGPRMLLRHPILPLQHLWVDGRRQTPELRPKATAGNPRRK